MDKNSHKRCIVNPMRTDIDITKNRSAMREKLTCLKRKRQIVEALELLVRSESRKGILRYYGSGIWKGDPSPWGEIEFDLGDPRSRSIVRCGSISWVLLRPVPVSNCGA